ncbi:hypothetical protein [Mesorhizobium sp. ZC-5]|uniref:hypothetical protein n=1 Tax=Mesorhizobium sp. ZC-5 TaxID=2986066 RepID=UPI0021E750D6|nr:hypothetical protein [Mesorhizobium sp. ZC-5]MCV3239674.1 hypothetical protein [Mesorhizobium sp. ZC-5]
MNEAAINLDREAGRLVSANERAKAAGNPLSQTAMDNLFRALMATGLDANEAFVARQKALQAARARHGALHHSLADLVACGAALDAAVDALRAKMSDFERRVWSIRASVEIDMDSSPFDTDWRDVLMARLNGKVAAVASWVPAYKRLRDGVPAHGSKELSA